MIVSVGWFAIITWNFVVWPSIERPVSDSRDQQVHPQLPTIWRSLCYRNGNNNTIKAHCWSSHVPGSFGTGDRWILAAKRGFCDSYFAPLESAKDHRLVAPPKFPMPSKNDERWESWILGESEFHRTTFFKGKNPSPDPLQPFYRQQNKKGLESGSSLYIAGCSNYSKVKTGKMWHFRPVISMTSQLACKGHRRQASTCPGFAEVIPMNGIIVHQWTSWTGRFRRFPPLSHHFCRADFTSKSIHW